MPQPETIILVSVDDLRYDAVEFSGMDDWLTDYDAIEYRNTPTFNNLANRSTNYDVAYSSSSYTPPSHATMFTGRYPSDHGVKTFFNRYDEGVTTLAETLRECGYSAEAWIENTALDLIDVTRGFERVVCPFENPEANLFEFVDQALSQRGKTFLFVHLFDVHKPYCYTPGGTEREQYNQEFYDRLDNILPSDCQASTLIDEAADEASETVPNYADLTRSLREYANNWSLDFLVRERLKERYGEDRFRYLVRLYQAGVSHFDQGRFRDLLEGIRNGSPDSLLLVTSDHGEARCRWGDREDFMNSFNVSEQAVRVPLVIKTDVELSEDLIDQPVSHIDIAPTIFDLVGADGDDDLPGVSLVEGRRNASEPRAIFLESWYYSGGADFFGNVSEIGEGGLSEIAVRLGMYKLRYALAETESPQEGLYDLGEDPFERANRFDEFPAGGEELAIALDNYLGDINRSCTPDIDDSTGDNVEDRLRALGYLE